MFTDPSTLSLADLEAHDPHPRKNTDEWRFLCPFPACAQHQNGLHDRCLNANVVTGAWNCKRCHEKGLLLEYRDSVKSSQGSASSGHNAAGNRQAMQRRNRELRRAGLSSAQPAVASPEKQTDWRCQIKGLQTLASTPGERYLAGRAIPVELAHRAGARFTPNFYGRPAVVFPIRDRSRSLVGVNGRYIAADANPKTRTGGSKSLGVFSTPGAWDMRCVVVTEAPIDALTVATCGYPAIAICGISSWPKWLPAACRSRHILIGFDAEPGADEAASKLATELSAWGAKVEQLRPVGGKDWNQVLTEHGVDALRASLDVVAGGLMKPLSDPQAETAGGRHLVPAFEALPSQPLLLELVDEAEIPAESRALGTGHEEKPESVPHAYQMGR